MNKKQDQKEIARNWSFYFYYKLTNKSNELKKSNRNHNKGLGR